VTVPLHPSALPALFIPSPGQGVWHLGPVPVRAYALCIIAGVIAAVWFGERRWVARGGRSGEIGDVALWAVPFGLIGARAYHVATDHALYFGAGKNPWAALEVWHGGLGIWGAIAGGAVGAWLACRQYGIRMRPLMDALAPSLLLAQAIGRWGNYFNQELFGRPTTKPWGLEIDASHRPPGYENYATFHPTFLYECLWDLGAMGVVLYLDRKLKLGYGRCFALYVMAYCLGRGWIEHLRIDTVEYNDVLGLRLNEWTSIVLFAAALVYFVVVGRRHPRPHTREESVYVDGRGPAAADADVDAAAPESDDVAGSTRSGTATPD
jgi:prolipoprotein diacylglyceryl transferase